MYTLPMASERPDAEQALLKALANFKKEVHSLKTRLGKLTGRVEQLELMDSQNQLTRLDERITKISDELTTAANQQTQALLLLQRSIAALRIDSLVHNSREIIEQELPNDSHLFTQLLTDASSAKGKLTTSNNPWEIAIQFKDKWEKLLHELGANTISY
jgi:chromosome segregation ATPase